MKILKYIFSRCLSAKIIAFLWHNRATHEIWKAYPTFSHLRPFPVIRAHVWVEISWLPFVSQSQILHANVIFSQLSESRVWLRLASMTEGGRKRRAVKDSHKMFQALFSLKPKIVIWEKRDFHIRFFLGSNVKQFHNDARQWKTVKGSGGISREGENSFRPFPPFLTRKKSHFCSSLDRAFFLPLAHFTRELFFSVFTAKYC